MGGWALAPGVGAVGKRSKRSKRSRAGRSSGKRRQAGASRAGSSGAAAKRAVPERARAPEGAGGSAPAAGRTEPEQGAESALESASDPATKATRGRSQSRLVALVALVVATSVGLALMLRARGCGDAGGPDSTSGEPTRAVAEGEDGPGPLLSPGPRPALRATPTVGTGTVTLAGAVVDMGGAPVSDAVVTATRELGPGLEEAAPGLATDPAVVAVADAAGDFTLQGLHPGRYRFTVAGEGFFRAEVRFFEVPADGVRVVVTRQVSVVGQVVQRSGVAAGGAGDAGGGVSAVAARGVPGVPVMLLRDGVIVARQDSDADGAFAFDELPEGVFQIWAGADTRAAPAQSVTRLGPGPFAPVTLALEAAFVVGGRVIDRVSRSGVEARVLLTATDSDEPPRYGVSDLSGSFAIAAVPPGRWRVEASAPGYVAAEAIEFDPSAATGASAPVVELSPGAALVGEVVDGRGQPVEGAMVSAHGVDSEGREVVFSADAEARQLARAQGLGLAGQAGAGRFIARGELGVLLGPIPFPPPPGSAPARVAVPIPELGQVAASSRNGADPPAQRDGGVGGAVIAESGVGGGDPLAASSEHQARYRTDARGQFRITGLPPGRFQLRASHPDYASARGPQLALKRGQRREQLKLVMVPGVMLVGLVTNTRDEPVVGATIAAEFRAPKRGAARSARPAQLASGPRSWAQGPHDDGAGVSFDDRVQTVTGSDGRYRLGPIALDLTLHVSAVRHGGATRKITIGALADLPDEQIERREDFTLVVADAAIRGRVRDSAGFPVRAAAVAIERADEHSIALGRRAESAEDGRFTIDGLARGRYQLTITHPDFPDAEAAAEADTRSDGQLVEIALAYGGGVEGEVRDAHSGAPLDGAEIIALGPDSARVERVADADGGFVLMPIAAGSWRLQASAPGYVAAQSSAIEVAAGTEPRQITARDVRVELSRGATVAGTVFDELGRRARGVAVRVGAGVGAAEARTDTEGRFRLDTVPTGEIVVRAERGEEGGSAEVTLRPGDEVLTLQLTITAQGD